MGKILNDLIAGVFNIAKGTRFMVGSIEQKTSNSIIKNLWDVNDSEYKSSFNLGTDGNTYANASYDTSGFMFIAGQSYVITQARKGTNYVLRICFYDINKAHLTGTSLANQNFNVPLAVPAGAYFCRVSIWKAAINNFHLEVGDVIHEPATKDYLTEFGRKTIGGQSLIENTIPLSKLNGYDRTVNLFDQYNILQDYYIEQSTGREVSSAGYRASDYIPVSESTAYIISGVGASANNAFYDVNKKYISGGVSSTVTFNSPVGAVYFRFSVGAAVDISIVQLEQASTATQYVPYVEITDIERTRVLRKKIQGKLFNFLGDSITSTGYYIDTLVSILKITGTKLGISGTTLGGAAGDAMWQDARINTISQSADYVIVYGGANDHSLSIPVGSVDSVDTSTVSGGLNTIITKIRRRCSGMTSTFTLTVSGTSGTATITGGKGLSHTFTFATDLTTSCANFVTANSAAYLAQGITLTSALNVITFTAGFTIDTPYFTNTGGNVSAVRAVSLTNTRTESARIIIFTPVYYEKANWAASGWTNSYTNTLGLQISDYCDAIKNVCNKRNVLVIDTNKCGINSENLRKYINDDGALVHHNQLGGAKVARFILNNLFETL